MAETALKSSPERKCSIQVAILQFHVFAARSRQQFKIQAKISTIRPVFPEYLSFSYDYEYRGVNAEDVNAWMIKYLFLYRP